MTRKIVTLHEDLSTFMTLSLWMRLRMRNISDKFGVKLEANIMYSVAFFSKILFLCGNLDNIVQSGRPQMTHNMEHSHCMLDTYVYKYTFRTYNSYCFSTATMVARRLLSVTLYEYSLSFLFIKAYLSRLIACMIHYDVLVYKWVEENS